MSRMVTIVIPEAPARDVADTATQSLRRVQRGLRLGVLDNSKSNADRLLGMVVEGVKAALPVLSVLSLRKPNASSPASNDILDQFAAGADCVIGAMAE